MSHSEIDRSIHFKSCIILINSILLTTGLRQQKTKLNLSTVGPKINSIFEKIYSTSCPSAKPKKPNSLHHIQTYLKVLADLLHHLQLGFISWKLKDRKTLFIKLANDTALALIALSMCSAGPLRSYQFYLQRPV